MKKSLGKTCIRCGADDWYVWTHGNRCAPCCKKSKWKGETPLPKRGWESPMTPKAIFDHKIEGLAWAAGLFEGEGNAIYAAQTTRLSVSQNDPWILTRLRNMFGGRVSQDKAPHNKLSSHRQWRWIVMGARARGIGMTIYPWLSPRRKEQMLRALHIEKVA